MKWNCKFIGSKFIINHGRSIEMIEVNYNIPGDIYHLEFNSIDDYKEHEDDKYLYILTDNLDTYDDEDEVPMISAFLIKHEGELVETPLLIKNYLEEEQYGKI